MKKRIAKVLLKVAKSYVNRDYTDPEARKLMYRRYYQALKKRYLTMSTHDQRRMIAEND